MDVWLHSIVKGLEPDELDLRISLGDQQPERFQVRCRRRSTCVGHILQRLVELGEERFRAITPDEVESLEKSRGNLTDSDLEKIPQLAFMLNIQKALGAFSCGVQQKFPVRLA